MPQVSSTIDKFLTSQALNSGEQDTLKTALGITSSVGKTLFVDSVNGNDGTAARGTSKPYLTLAAAKTAAQSGDTIVVRPGAYTTTTDLLKNGVNWHFETGSSVTATGTAIIFGQEFVGSPSPSAFVCKITGNGRFVATSAVILVQNTGTDIYFEADYIKGGDNVIGYGAITFYLGKLTVKADMIEGYAYDALLVNNAAAAGTFQNILNVNCRHIKASTGQAVEVNGADVVTNITATTLESTQQDAVMYVEGKLFIKCHRIISASSYGLYIQGSPFNKETREIVIAADIIQQGNLSGDTSVYVLNDEIPTTTLIGCVMGCVMFDDNPMDSPPFTAENKFKLVNCIITTSGTPSVYTFTGSGNFTVYAYNTQSDGYCESGITLNSTIPLSVT